LFAFWRQLYENYHKTAKNAIFLRQSGHRIRVHFNIIPKSLWRDKKFFFRLKVLKRADSVTALIFMVKLLKIAGAHKS
jgi:hypothetical protein